MRYLHPLFRFYSVLAGFVSRIYIPKKSRKTVFYFFGRVVFGMSRNDFSESAKPIDNYKNINEFFTRPLDSKYRPIHHHKLLAPCDGRTIDCGSVLDGNMLTRVKGTSYSLIKLLLDRAFVPVFKSGSFCNIYLSPRNYHRFHAPCSGTVKKLIHIGGCCYPVNDWGQRLKDLYSINERYILHIESNSSNICMVAIGAAAVSKIDIKVKEGDHVAKGDLLGFFELGSSIMLISNTKLFSPTNIILGNVKAMGQIILNEI